MAWERRRTHDAARRQPELLALVAGGAPVDDADDRGERENLLGHPTLHTLYPAPVAGSSR